MLQPRTESDQTFDPNWRSGRFGSRGRINHRSSEGLEFNPGEIENAPSGVHSPPLWRSSSPPHRSNDFRSLSPASRTQAIVRGQRELMEMVKTMPESSYELSLKDLVEHHNKNHQQIPSRLGSPKEESCLLDKKSYDDDDQVINRQESYKRQESAGDDVFVKMTVFPVSFKSMKTLKKKKSSNSYTNSYPAAPATKNDTSKVSPAVSKPEAATPPFDKDLWWKKRFSGSSGSESGVTNSSSNPSGSTGSSGSCSSGRSHGGRRPPFRKRMGLLRSCCSCFCSPKANSAD